jgi:hypothetical protein
MYYKKVFNLFSKFWLSFLFVNVLLVSFFGRMLMAQEDDTSLQQEGNKIRNKQLPYFLDDVMLIVGLNRSGLYFSDQFRDLSYGSGYNIGAEGYLPLGKITFLNYGVHFSQRSFYHLPDSKVKFDNYYLDFPVYVSFSLPELKRIDWRFFLGTQLTYRLSSSQVGEYPILGEDFFQFEVRRFKNLDGGMTFGLSAEARDFFFRLRSYVGVNNLDELDQGTMNSFNVELGYFLFRKYRK